MPLTPEDRRRNGRKGALTTLSNSGDWSALTAPARSAFRDSFDAKVDPDGTMDPQQRAKCADAAYRLHFVTMAEAKKAKAARRAAARV